MSGRDNVPLLQCLWWSLSGLLSCSESDELLTKNGWLSV